MHSHKTSNDTIFNYNSDFSGDIRICKDGQEMWIKGTDILEFVAYSYVASNKISKIEDMDYKELLNT